MNSIFSTQKAKTVLNMSEYRESQRQPDSGALRGKHAQQNGSVHKWEQTPPAQLHPCQELPQPN